MFMSGCLKVALVLSYLAIKLAACRTGNGKN